MQRSGPLQLERVAFADRLVRRVEQALRVLGDPRLALALLGVAAVANAVAAALPGGARILAGPPYAALLGAILVSGLAATAVRLPAAWREWRRPGQVSGGPTLEIPLAADRARPPEPSVLAGVLRSAGYRVGAAAGATPRRAPTLRAVRRGWSRPLALLSHAALVCVVVGAAIGAAFGSETRFSLLPGEEAFIADPREGGTAAVRLDDFQAEFGADGRPRRLDTHVTLLRDGRAVDQHTLRVNEPASLDGHLVHAWTYGPAVTLRVVTLGGRPLLDGPLPLDAVVGGRQGRVVELPTLDAALGVSLVDAAANEIGVSLAAPGGTDAVRLRPGEERRLGGVNVRLEAFAAYVTFLARRDPGLGILFAGAIALTISLATALWFPRQRVMLRLLPERLVLTLRGERLDDPRPELDRLERRLREAIAS